VKATDNQKFAALTFSAKMPPKQGGFARLHGSKALIFTGNVIY
jgi:hypothetical protein